MNKIGNCAKFQNVKCFILSDIFNWRSSLDTNTNHKDGFRGTFDLARQDSDFQKINKMSHHKESNNDVCGYYTCCS